MKLTDMNLFEGKKFVITLSELRSRPGDVFTQVQMGAEFEVTKNKKVIAVIASPVPIKAVLAKACAESIIVATPKRKRTA